MQSGKEIKRKADFDAAVIVIDKLNQFAETMGVTIAAISILADDEDGVHAIQLTGFNPHFKECGCKGCKQAVATIKLRVAEASDLGVMKYSPQGNID